MPRLFYRSETLKLQWLALQATREWGRESESNRRLEFKIDCSVCGTSEVLPGAAEAIYYLFEHNRHKPWITPLSRDGEPVIL